MSVLTKIREALERVAAKLDAEGRKELEDAVAKAEAEEKKLKDDLGAAARAGREKALQEFANAAPEVKSAVDKALLMLEQAILGHLA